MPKASFHISLKSSAPKVQSASSTPAVSQAYQHNSQVANKAANRAISKARGHK
jgi:hypothetical protein